MFPSDALMKNYHDLHLAPKLVKGSQAAGRPKSKTAQPATARRLAGSPVALAAFAPIVLWLIWVFAG